jgi:PAS domain-containing protein
MLGQQLSAANSSTAAAQAVLDAADELWAGTPLTCNSTRRITVTPCRFFYLTLWTESGRRFLASYREVSPRDKRIIEFGAEWVQGPVSSSQPAFVSFGVRSRPTASRLFAPIRSGAKVIGSISVQSYTDNAYRQEDLAVLQTLADFCSATLERIQAEESLRKSEERFSKAFRSSPMPMSLSTLEQGVYVDMNESMLRLFGYNARKCSAAPRWSWASGTTRKNGCACCSNCRKPSRCGISPAACGPRTAPCATRCFRWSAWISRATRSF